jgi:hypothetical protein
MKMEIWKIRIDSCIDINNNSHFDSDKWKQVINTKTKHVFDSLIYVFLLENKVCDIYRLHNVHFSEPKGLSLLYHGVGIMIVYGLKVFCFDSVP